MRNLFNLSQFRSHRALRLPAGRALRINFGLWPKSRCPSVVRAFGVSRLRSTRAGLGSALIAVLAFASPAAAQDVAIVNAKLVIGDGSAPIEGGTVVVRRVVGLSLIEAMASLLPEAEADLHDRLAHDYQTDRKRVV